GSHGKTTTSSLIGHLLSSLGYDPTVFLGGLPLNYSRGAWWGKGYFVAETDESDASFLFYEPWVSIITNIDHEHIDHYGSFQNLEEKFLQFALKTSGKVIGWGDQSQVSKIISKTGGLSFGWSKGNLVRGEGFYFDGKCSCFNLYLEDQFFMPVKVPLLGEHNCLNVLAAFAVFLYLGEDLKKVNRMLETFQGSRRRFQVKDKCQRVVFVDDYAHHPTEIKAVIKAARLLKPKRLFLVLQPHRFSRVQMLKDSFYDCILGADRVVVTDIYSAQEKNISGLKSQDLLEGMKRNFFGRIDYIPQDKLAQDLPFLIEEGDLVLALGAGNINTIMQEVVDVFKKNRIKA
ncbi:MAG: Mur ligase family protein, partial [Candidatus Omnitrophota bacterium]